MLTARAVNHGFRDEKYPKTAAATKTIIAEIAVSSQVGRASIHVIKNPAIILRLSCITDAFFTINLDY
jgi:hypothetical protein